MNLNSLILTNIQSSSYFKVQLFKLKTYHEVVDEIYYQVKHLEPWERGSRKTAGQTGMCGGVGTVLSNIGDGVTNFIAFRVHCFAIAKYLYYSPHVSSFH